MRGIKYSIRRTDDQKTLYRYLNPNYHPGFTIFQGGVIK